MHGACQVRCRPGRGNGESKSKGVRREAKEAGDKPLARPHQPAGKGKIERFFRRSAASCSAPCSTAGSLDACELHE